VTPRIRLGITLPSFVRDPEQALAVARAAEAAALDGVFVFDHLFRRGAGGTRRPALEGTTLLTAVAAETRRVHVGTLVVRATLRAPATLVTAVGTAHRIARDRLIVGVGAGDSESRDENEAFGLAFGSFDDRVSALRHAVLAVRGHGHPVWVGGTAPAVRAVAGSVADGWNRWGSNPARFAAEVADVRAAAGSRPFTVSWGGLMVTAADESALEVKRRRLAPPPDVLVGVPEQLARAVEPYVRGGAEWIILGPADSSNPENATLLGERLAPLLHVHAPGVTGP